MSSSVTSTNGVVVVTHVYPAGNGIGAVSPPHYLGQAVYPAGNGVGAASPHCLGQAVSSALANFRKADPKALGTVQIMIGLMMALTGIVMCVNYETLGVGEYSGIFVWGATFYIIAGSLTVAADKKLNRCLVKGSLGMNIIAAITASASIIFYSLDAADVLFYTNCNYEDESWRCELYRRTAMGISGVMAVFNFLELIVSIYLSSFACKAVCKDCCTSTPEQVFVIGTRIPQGSTVAPNLTPYHPPNFEAFGDPKGPEEVCTAVPQNDLPPQYTANIA